MSSAMSCEPRMLAAGLGVVGWWCRFAAFRPAEPEVWDLGGAARGPRGPARHRRPSVAVLPSGKCCRIFCGVPPGVPETWFFCLHPRARGNSAQFFAGRFPRSGCERLGVPLVTKGKCCPIFRGAPGGGPRGGILHPRAMGNAAQFFAGRFFREWPRVIGRSLSD